MLVWDCSDSVVHELDPEAVSEPTHDALFKAVFGQVENASGVLQGLLEPELARSIRWGSLALEPGSFVDRRLRHRHSDLLFSAETDASTVRLYVLFEHQSTRDPWMPLRLLRYMVRIWTALVEAQPTELLPVIVPLVLSHAPSGWTVERDFAHLVDPHLRGIVPSVVPDFKYAVWDLAEAPRRELQRPTHTDEAALALWLLQAVRDGAAFVHGLSAWADVFARLERHPRGREKLTRLLQYVVNVGADMQLEEIHAILQDAAPDAGEILMTTIADRLIAEGKARGLAEGKARGQLHGKSASLLVILEARGVRIDAAQRARIEACSSEDELDRWTVRALTASCAADLFES